jgi:hypothetical protein
VNRQIARVAFSVSAVVAVTIPAFFVPACLSSPTTPSDAGSSSSSGGSGSGSGSGSSSGAPSDGGTVATGCLGPDAGAVPSSCVIDDMTGLTVVGGGYWYTYSDRTFPNTTDVVDGSASVMGTVIATSAGVVTPAEGDQFPAALGDVMPGGPTVPGVSGPAPYREFIGSGLTLWGAGMGFNWTNVLPDAGAVDLDAAAAADAAPVLGTPGPYDASGHKGMTFYGKSNGSGPVVVGIHFSDARNAAAGGECDASVYLNSPVECGDDYFKNYTFAPTWGNFVVKFADMALKTQDYSGMHLPPGALDTTKLYQVHFQVNNGAFKGTGATDAAPGFDISVAYVTWYDGP